MGIQRIFSIAVFAISILGIYGSTSLRMFRGTSLGPGFMPLLYSIILLILSAMLFFSSKDQPKIKWAELFDSYRIKGWIYYLANLIMVAMIYIIGMIPAMAIFGISSQVILKRQKLLGALVFTLVWVGAIYVIFVVILKIPFTRGILFD